MGQTLPNDIYLPAEGERNCYDGLEGNWRSLDSLISTVAGKASATHTHGNISNDGKVGTTANLPLITGTGGAIQAGSFGNAANTFCEGNDSRLSDARTPVAHTHGKADITDLFNSANVWSALNTYSNGQIRIKSQSQERGVTPSNNVIQYLEFADKNNAQHGIVGLWDYSNGASELQMYITDKFKNGAKDPTGTTETTILSFGFKTDGSKFLTFSGQVDNSVIPKTNNTYDLGNSSFKWKTLNGINPGALSLPNSPGGSGTVNVNYYDLSSIVTIKDGSGVNSYQPVCDGWIAINSFATWIQIANDTTLVCVTGAIGADGFGQCYLPVRKNDNIRIVINQTNTNFQSFKLIPCQGNV